MRREPVVRVAVAVGLLVVAGAGFALWIPAHVVDEHRLVALGVTRPVSGLRAKPTVETLSPSTSPLAAVKAAASATPAGTGTLAVGWRGVAKNSSASVSLTVLPSLRDAEAAQNQADTRYLATSALLDQGDRYAGTLAVAGVPHAAGASFVSATSTTGTVKLTAERVDVAEFRVGHVVCVVFVDGSADDAPRALDALATAEYRHLERVGADPDLAETTVPVVAATVYAVAALAVIGAVESVPTARRVVHERRLRAHEAAIRRQRAARGSKVVKRQVNRVRTKR